MHCAACSARIERAVGKLPGVYQAVVNLAVEKAVIEVNPAEVTSAMLIAKIESLGFGAQPIAVDADGAAGADREKAARQQDIKRQQFRLILSAVFSLPLILAMVLHLMGSDGQVTELLMNPYLQWFLATPVQFIAGGQFYRGAYLALKNGGANMDVLVVLGTSAAYFYSIANMLYSPHNLYFETSAILITLIILGKLLEARAKGRTSEAIKALMGLQAKTARVVRNGKDRKSTRLNSSHT
jgi:Cu+-exporting ATPase